MAVLYVLGVLRLHTRDFDFLMVCVPALAAASVLVIILTHKKGERIVREPFEED